MRNEDWSALPSRKLEDSYPSLDLIKAIVAQGGNVNAKLTKNLPGRSGMDAGDTTLDEGTTPFMRAARSGDAATMRVLLEAGADPKLATKEGTTALRFAAGVGYRDKQTKGTEAEALEALKVCVDQGMDINQANSKGETALHGAASRGADSIVKYLVEHGAKLDAKTRRGFTPLDVAMGKDQFGLPVPHDSTVALIRSWEGLKARTDRTAKRSAGKRDAQVPRGNHWDFASILRRKSKAVPGSKSLAKGPELSRSLRRLVTALRAICCLKATAYPTLRAQRTLSRLYETLDRTGRIGFLRYPDSGFLSQPGRLVRAADEYRQEPSPANLRRSAAGGRTAAPGVVPPAEYGASEARGRWSKCVASR